MHDLNEWENREGELIGGSVLLTAEEVKEARQKGSIEIEVSRL